MSDREALASALEKLPVNDPDWRWDLPLTDIVAAARKQLALMPQDCECMSKHYDERVGHGPCHGSGKVYPAELVERIATALLARWESATTYGGVADYREDAVAVLDALGETE